jgi:hypothetical protein
LVGGGEEPTEREEDESLREWTAELCEEFRDMLLDVIEFLGESEVSLEVEGERAVEGGTMTLGSLSKVAFVIKKKKKKRKRKKKERNKKSEVRILYQALKNMMHMVNVNAKTVITTSITNLPPGISSKRIPNGTAMQHNTTIL